MSGPSVDFFERQFARQVESSDYALNPFERRALGHVAEGRTFLDLGCGLGNLSLAAARAGASVTALDASGRGIADLRRRAGEEGLPVDARVGDLRHWQPDRRYDTVACIGLLMFFARDDALAQLGAVASAVAPGGVAVVNVLVEGTTYLDMFDPAAYHLFTREELLAAFAGWEVLALQEDAFPAPGTTTKRFLTIAARRPIPRPS